MQASPEAVALIKAFEGLSLKPYRCPAGIWTVGWGSTRGVAAFAEKGLTLTLEDAERLLQEEVDRVADAVSAALEGLELEQHQFDALCSFVFNVGPGAFEASTLLRKLKARDFEGAALEFDRWVFAGGKRLAGLSRRREAEKRLFYGFPAVKAVNSP